MKLFSLSAALLFLLAGAVHAQGATGSSVTSADAERLIALHNAERARLGLPGVRWDPAVARYAQEWADHLARTCQITHRSGSNNRNNYGENLAMGSGSFGVANAFALWAGEKKGFRNGRFTSAMMRRGHYTQIIWRGTTAIGCGIARCGSMTIVVCNYNPPGNVIGVKVY